MVGQRLLQSPKSVLSTPMTVHKYHGSSSISCYTSVPLQPWTNTQLNTSNNIMALKSILAFGLLALTQASAIPTPRWEDQQHGCGEVDVIFVYESSWS